MRFAGSPPQATIHLRKLVVLAQKGDSAQRDIRAPELLLLIAIVEVDFNRRMRTAMATLARMLPDPTQ